MLWIKTEEGHYQAGEFTIYLRKHYYYELVHSTDGIIHKYRLLDGAKRAADLILVSQKREVE